MKIRTKSKESTEPKVTLTIKIPLKEKIALIEEAKRRNITVTELIRIAIKQELKISKKFLHGLTQDL